MSSEALDLFQNLTLLGGMTRTAIDALFAQGSVVRLNSGDELFAQGSESDALYVLLQGRLLAIGFDPVMNTEHVSGFIQPGEVVGEMGLISHRPRSLTIRSQLDSLLFRLGDVQFSELLDQHPEILTPITRSLIARLQQTLTRSHGARCPQTVMLIPANQSVKIDLFLEGLKSTLSQSHFKTIIVTEHDAKGQLGSQDNPSDLLNWMASLDNDYDFVFYSCTDPNSDWFRYGLQFAERFVVIANGNSPVHYDRRVIDNLDSKNRQHYVKELVLLYETNATELSNVSNWLHGVNYYRHHHVDLQHNNSIERFCRFVTGNANALVLAGGGTRGWAHVGAMRAFHEHGMEFDLVGGTSAGSVVAAIYATGADYEHLKNTMDMMLRASLDVVKFTNYTWPIVSITNARANTELLQRVFSNTHIEQLERLFFCVSCNISNSQETIHTQGLLWQAIRASCSVPGLAPPVAIDGDLYVDGGIVNNMPVDIARHRLDGLGHIVAVDLSMTKDEKEHYYFPPILSLPHLLAHRLKLIKRDYRFTTLGNIIMATMMASSERRGAENRELADLVIRPSLQGYGMMDDARDDLIRLGYQAAIDAITL